MIAPTVFAAMAVVSLTLAFYCGGKATKAKTVEEHERYADAAFVAAACFVFSFALFVVTYPQSLPPTYPSK